MEIRGLFLWEDLVAFPDLNIIVRLYGFINKILIDETVGELDEWTGKITIVLEYDKMS